jgi:hypothetical protein
MSRRKPARLSAAAEALLAAVDASGKVVVGDGFEHPVGAADELVAARLAVLTDHYVQDGRVARAVAAMDAKERLRRNALRQQPPKQRRPLGAGQGVSITRTEHGWHPGLAGRVVSDDGRGRVLVDIGGGQTVEARRRDVRP